MSWIYVHLLDIIVSFGARGFSWLCLVGYLVPSFSFFRLKKILLNKKNKLTGPEKMHTPRNSLTNICPGLNWVMIVRRELYDWHSWVSSKGYVVSHQWAWEPLQCRSIKDCSITQEKICRALEGNSLSAKSTDRQQILKDPLDPVHY